METGNTRAWDDELRGKQRLFVLFYCTDAECFLNGTKAYSKAYPDCTGSDAAAVSASKMLRKAKVKTAIRHLLRIARDDLDDKMIHKLLHQYEVLSFYNPADIITASGGLIVDDLKELGELAMCVEGIETKVNQAGQYTVIKLVNRFKAMEALAKYLKLIKPDVEIDVSMPVVYLEDKNTGFEYAKDAKTIS